MLKEQKGRVRYSRARLVAAAERSRDDLLRASGHEVNRDDPDYEAIRLAYKRVTVLDWQIALLLESPKRLSTRRLQRVTTEAETRAAALYGN